MGEDQGQQSSHIDDLERAFREGDFQRALELIHVLTALYPNSPELPVLMVKCYIGMRRPVRAFFAAQKFKGDPAGNPGLLELMRVVYHELLLDDRAMQIARNLIQTGAASEDCYYYYVLSLLHGEHAVEASKPIADGLVKHPDSERLKYAKGLLHLKLGERNDASAIAAELTAQGSPFGAELSSLTDTGRSQPDRQVSAEAAEKSRDYMKKATEFLANDDPEAASRAVIAAIRLDDSFALAYTRLGYIYDLWGLHDESMDLHKKAIEKDPALIEAYRNLAYSRYKKGDIKQAVDTYEKALEVDPGNIEIRNSLGVVHDNLGDHEKAIFHFQQALKSNPESEATWRNLGFAYQAQGRLDDAIAAYKSALRINPDSPADVNLATLYRILQQYRNAKKILHHIVRKTPDSIMAWLELALCHRGLREKKFAEVYKKAKGMTAKNPPEAFTKAQIMELLDERVAYDCWNTYLAMAQEAPQEARRSAYARDRVSSLGSKLGIKPPAVHIIGQGIEKEE